VIPGARIGRILMALLAILVMMSMLVTLLPNPTI
jgi:hypothetical protein